MGSQVLCSLKWLEWTNQMLCLVNSRGTSTGLKKQDGTACVAASSNGNKTRDDAATIFGVPNPWIFCLATQVKGSTSQNSYIRELSDVIGKWKTGWEVFLKKNRSTSTKEKEDPKIWMNYSSTQVKGRDSLAIPVQVGWGNRNLCLRREKGPVPTPTTKLNEKKKLSSRGR